MRKKNRKSEKKQKIGERKLDPTWGFSTLSDHFCNPFELKNFGKFSKWISQIFILTLDLLKICSEFVAYCKSTTLELVWFVFFVFGFFLKILKTGKKNMFGWLIFKPNFLKVF